VESVLEAWEEMEGLDSPRGDLGRVAGDDGRETERG